MRMGADVNARRYRGWTPLHFAAQRGHNNVTKVLIEAGAHLELRAQFYANIQGWEKLTNSTALQIAIEGCHSSVVGSLVDAGAKVEEKDLLEALPVQDWPETPLILQHLLSSGISPDIEDEYGSTLLMYAAGRGYVESFRILLAAGAELNRKDPDENRTALMWTRENAKVIDGLEYPG